MLLAAWLLQACNGGGSSPEEAPVVSEYERLRAEASLRADEVAALVSPLPCTQSSQCASLVLAPQLPPCFFNIRYDYSLVSPTAAAASAAASAFNALSAQAYAIQPPGNTTGSCSENVDLTPLACVAGQCVRQFVVEGPPVSGPQPEGIWIAGPLQIFISLVNAVWVVDTGATTPTVYTGSLTADGANLTGSLSRLVGATATVADLVATISDMPTPSITLEKLEGVANTPTRLDATPNFFSASSLGQVAGTYDLSTGERIVLEPTGAVRSADAGCSLTGGFDAAWSDRNVYQLGVVFGPAPCKNPGAFIEGVLAPLPGGGQFLAAKRLAPNVAAVGISRVN